MKNHQMILVNCDTDSISVNKPNNLPFTENERNSLLIELNSLFPETIKWEDDGYFSSVVVLKAKNYALWDGKKIKIKGSAFKSSSREIALKELMNEFLDVLLKENLNQEELDFRLVSIYHKYINEALNVQDIKRWASKKTITEKVMRPERTNEQKIADALEGTEYSEGEKRWFFFTSDDKLCLVEKFQGDYHKTKLIEKIWKTVAIFKPILDINMFKKYHLKKYQKELNNLVAL